MKIQVDSARIEHGEAMRFISNFERTIKRKARRLQEREKLSYTDARDLVCTEFGLKNQYQLSQLMRSLRERAEFFSTQEDRIRCALEESPESQVTYYLFDMRLGLQGAAPDGSRYLEPISVITLKSHWVGWVDESHQEEFRVASLVEPELVIELFRNKLGRTVYVLNHETDVCLWMLAWGGIGLVNAELVRKFDFLSRWLAPFKCGLGSM